MNEVVDQLKVCTEKKTKTERDKFIKKMSVQIMQNFYNDEDIKKVFIDFKKEMTKSKIDELNDLNRAFDTIDRILFK